MEILQSSLMGKFLNTKKDNNGKKCIAMVGDKAILYTPVVVEQNSVYKVTLEILKESGNGVLYCNIYNNRNFDFPHVRLCCDCEGWSTYTINVETKEFPNTLPMLFRIWRGDRNSGIILIKKIKIELVRNKEKQNIEKLNKEKQNIEKLNNNNVINYVIITNVDGLLFFNTCEIFKELMETVGLNTLLINKWNNNNYLNQLNSLKNYNIDCIILYRTDYIPNNIIELKKLKKIPLGYMIDDNLFYLENDNLINDKLKESIRNVIKKVDFCIACNETLACELKKININSHFLMKPIIWEDVFKKRNIICPQKNNTEIIRIGIISGVSHYTITKELIIYLFNELKYLNNFKIIYFLRSPINIKSDKLEYYSYISYNVTNWYNMLHNLKLDLVCVEYPNNNIIKSKSNLKFRETAFMRIPLIAIDPTSNIFKNDIINGENGYIFSSRFEAISVIKELLKSKLKISLLGENAYNSLIKVPPNEIAYQIISVINQAIKNVNK